MSVTTLLRQLHEAANRGDWGGVEQIAATLVALSPQLAEVWFLSGIAALEQRRMTNALARLKNAVALAPEQVRYRVHWARALAIVDKLDEAVEQAQAAIALNPPDALSLDTLGVILSRAHEHGRAVTLFERAVQLQPDNASYQFNLASSLKFIGRFEAAEQAYEVCIEAQPHFWKAHSALAQLRRQTPGHHHLDRLGALLPETGGDADAELHLRMALFKECEDLGDFDAAFAHLSAGKSAKRPQLRYDASRDQALFDTAREQFSELATGPLAEACGPVFVVGMPRTGTTLVERVLSSHPLMQSIGESQHLGRAVKHAARTSAPRLLDAPTLIAARLCEPRAIGDDYLRRVQKPHRVVDKTPLNFFYAGLLRRALPQARVVCLRRHPLDACLSNYRQLFALQYSYYDYAYDLLDIGRYYIAFDRLMRHWSATLPGYFIEIRYEDLVEHQERETRRLLGFCGLPWDDVCLAFERNEQPVSTASAVQVRSPIYRSALQRWKRYESALKPLRQLLECAGIDCR